MSTPRIALIAHDAKKDDIVALAGAGRGPRAARPRGAAGRAAADGTRRLTG